MDNKPPYLFLSDLGGSSSCACGTPYPICSTTSIGGNPCFSGFFAQDGGQIQGNNAAVVAVCQSNIVKDNSTACARSSQFLASFCGTISSSIYTTIAASYKSCVYGGNGSGGFTKYNTIMASKYGCVTGTSCYSGVFASVNSYVGSYCHSFLFGVTACNAGGNNRSTFDIIDKTLGSFVIDHPDPDKACTHRLIHYFVEAPTNGDTIYRYEVSVTNGTGELLLPTYFKHLNKNVQFKLSGKDVLGTARATIDQSMDVVTVTADTDGVYNVLIFATRKDEGAIKNWQGVERLKPMAN